MTAEQPTNERSKPIDADATVTGSNASAIWVIVLGIASFALGFALVHVTLPDAPSADSEPKNCGAAAAPSHENPVSSESVETSDAPDDASDEASDDPTDLSAAGAGGLPEVPPAPTPDGIRMDGAPLYYKCWASGDASGTKECDRLRVLEKRMATRLYVVDECKKAHGKDDAPGLLSLGANLDFSDNTIKFWSGPSSTLDNASKIGNCVRQKLAGLPLYSVDHKYEKYRMFFSIDFFDPKQRERMLAQKRKKGRQVQVVKDKVNVREEPVDGASIGRISSDSTVTLLKKNDTGDWCNVLTPSNREGWMICDALKL
ncbi:MAG: SH3 domain-containing protein [Deltaproteobacteria bacterium]|nr:SH3 domain-containing protein [Deltaproteobacteria bacterium]MBN2673617.1 SH3 domain-containing protein [Deltaproteobacteria bacterium]